MDPEHDRTKQLSRTHVECIHWSIRELQSQNAPWRIRRRLAQSAHEENTLIGGYKRVPHRAVSGEATSA